MPLQGEYEPSPVDFVREQIELIESSGGTQGITDAEGRGVIVLTTIGAKSGKVRKSALMRVEHDGVYAIVASKGGSRTNPVWVSNVQANPHVELQDGPERHDYLARQVHGAERNLWWQRSVEAFPNYADYQARTEREIPVFILERMQ